MNMEALPVMHRRGGYEIRGDGKKIVFILRRTHGPGIVAAVSGGLAGIFIANGLMQLYLAGSPAAPYLLVPGAVLLAICVLFTRTFLRRKKAAPDDIPVRYLMDLESGIVRDASGTTIARLDSMAFACAYNFFSRTYGLFMILPQKRKIEVYAERVPWFSSTHVRAVREELERAVAARR